MDGLSGVLLLLNAFLLIVVVVTTWEIKTEKLRLYYFLIFTCLGPLMDPFTGHLSLWILCFLGSNANSTVYFCRSIWW